MGTAMKQSFFQNCGLADFWFCQAEKDMSGFVIRDKQSGIFTITQEAYHRVLKFEEIRL